MQKEKANHHEFFSVGDRDIIMAPTSGHEEGLRNKRFRWLGLDQNPKSVLDASRRVLYPSLHPLLLLL
jgi:hypothetical protein